MMIVRVLLDTYFILVILHSLGLPNEEKVSRPSRPVPRIEDLGSLLQRENMSQSSNNSLGYKAKCFHKLPYFYFDEMEKTYECTSTEYENGSFSVTVRQNAEGTGHQMATGKTEELIQSVRHDHIIVHCLINGKPADFSLPDDDNVYMRGNEYRNFMYVSPP